MGVFDKELTLPGVITDILPTTASSGNVDFGTTESVTVIGTAFNGPVGQPIAIGSPEQAKYMFGDSFDPQTKRKATLVPEIQDAYSRGCRTIYAVRVSGKEMSKDFELATETNLKLRLSGYYPHNGNKKCFMTYTATQGSGTAFGNEEGVIRIYKPADRTVISEKIAGVVDTTNSILVTEIFLDSEGFTKDSRLCDVIDVVNAKNTNNVLKLSIVDENGIQKTNATKEVQEISVGALFPGIYTICRDEAGKNVKVVTDIEVKMADIDGKLYPSSTDKVWVNLKANTNPAKPYPIFANTFAELSTLLGGTLGTLSSFDFLKQNGMIDAVAVMNDDDYEEVELSGFELYKRLGSGFVRNAKLEQMKSAQGVDIEGKFKVIAAKDGDERRVDAIEDGIYSILQMHESDYTVLAAATAETDVTGKLPKKTAFRKAETKKISLNNLMVCTPKIDETDIESAIVKYKMSVARRDDAIGEELASEDIASNLCEGKFLRVAAVDAKANAEGKLKGIENGTLVFDVAGTKLFKVINKKLVDVDPSLIGDANVIINDVSGELKAYKATGSTYTLMTESDFTGLSISQKKYIAVMSGAKANICEVKLEVSTVVITPLMSLKNLADGVLEDEDFTLCYAEEDMPALGDSQTIIKVISTECEYSSIEELADTFNSKDELKNRFVFEAASDKALEEIAAAVELKGSGANKEEGFKYDTEMYIAYTTTDNFARHLAQHCLYTSLKNYPTHGVIGCDKLTGVSLSTIANRVKQVSELNLDMSVKKGNGNYLYNSDNTPIPVGRCVSVVFAQYPVTTGNGYNYISSGASGYAGMVSTLSADRSSTNQVINISTNNLMMNLSNYQLTKLNAAGIVCVRQVGDTVVVVDGITQAPIDSAYRRLSTTKIINAVAKLLRDAIQPFIGLPQSTSNMNSMETAVKSVLNSVKGVLINDYKYALSTNNADSSTIGVVDIAYMITPAYEIKQVRNKISIS